MYANAQTLLLGIGGFGVNILKYLQENRESFILPSYYDTLILCNDTHPKKEVLPNFGTMFEEYKRIIIFVEIDGTYASDVLQTILKQDRLEIEKFYIVAVAPYSFEGRAKAFLAQTTLSMLIASKIGCGLFANSQTMDKTNENVRKEMEDFNKKIIESIPWYKANCTQILIVNQKIDNDQHRDISQYAVLMEYDENSHKLPVVMAKGLGEFAMDMQKRAVENNIHIVQNAPLAKVLCMELDIGQFIPENLYVAVAEVIAHAFMIPHANTQPYASIKNDKGEE